MLFLLDSTYVDHSSKHMIDRSVPPCSPLPHILRLKCWPPWVYI